MTAVHWIVAAHLTVWAAMAVLAWRHWRAGAPAPRTIRRSTMWTCGCGCGLPLEDAKREARANPGWLNPDQAEADVVRGAIKGRR